MSKASEKMTAKAIDEGADDAPESQPKIRSAHAFAPPVAQPAGAGMWIGNTWTIASREFRSYFDSIIGWVVLGVGMLALGGYFFWLPGNFWQTDRATMARMFDFLPLALPMVFALVTMKTIAEEKRMGTLELLITLPVRDSEVIMGKYLGALGLVVTLLLAALIYPLAMFVWPWNFGPLDWGPVWAGYLGLFFYSAAGVAIGILYSSITESQIVAFFLTLVTIYFFYAIGLGVEALSVASKWGGDALAFVSFQTRFQNFARGIIDTRALVYFLSIAVICLLVAFRNLESRKWK